MSIPPRLKTLKKRKEKWPAFHKEKADQKK
jgi:hypothetical protein